jgi:hypothetical protein
MGLVAFAAAATPVHLEHATITGKLTPDPRLTAPMQVVVNGQVVTPDAAGHYSASVDAVGTIVLGVQVAAGAPGAAAIADGDPFAMETAVPVGSTLGTCRTGVLLPLTGAGHYAVDLAGQTQELDKSGW